MKRLEPIGNKFTVPPRDENYASEFEVQAFLYGELRRRAVDVRGEVKWFDPELRVQCRFDLVIYRDGVAAEIIEVKAAARKWTRTPLEDTRQGRRYRLFGVPVTFVFGLDDALAYLRAAA